MRPTTILFAVFLFCITNMKAIATEQKIKDKVISPEFPCDSSENNDPVLEKASGIVERVRKVTAEQLGVNESEVKNESFFIDDLGADSLDLVELVMAMEEEFEFEIPNMDAEKLLTVHDATNYILQRFGECKVVLKVNANNNIAIATKQTSKDSLEKYEAKQKFERSKPHINIGTIGHVGHGKTTLTAAIAKVLAEKSGGVAKSYDQINLAPEYRSRGITIKTAHVEYETENRHYAHMDSPNHIDYVKNLIIGSAQLDGAILVVSLVDGPMSQTEEHIRLARQIGVPNIVVYLNKADLVNDKKQIEQIEKEVRILLDSHGYPGNDIPVVIGSALKALEGDTSDIGVPSVLKLLELIDSYLPTPKRAIEKPFLMPVEDVFAISGRGTVATGRVEHGIAKVGDELEIVGINSTQKSVVSGVEMFRKLLDQAQAGDNVGIILRDIKHSKIERGQVLAEPGSISPYTRFLAEIYLLSTEDGGRNKPITKGYRPQFYFRTTDITGHVELPAGTETAIPGDNLPVAIKLVRPIALEKGLRFAIREGGRTVGAGVVTGVLE